MARGSPVNRLLHGRLPRDSVKVTKARQKNSDENVLLSKQAISSIKKQHTIGIEEESKALDAR